MVPVLLTAKFPDLHLVLVYTLHPPVDEERSKGLVTKDTSEYSQVLDDFTLVGCDGALERSSLFLVVTLHRVKKQTVA